MGDQQRHAGTVAGAKRRTAIEAETADPQHAGADYR